MNDLDELIRTTLHEHTPAAASDDALAGRVQATGRRIRRTRAAGAAVAVLVAVGGLAWGATEVGRLTHPPIAAAPSTSAPSTSAPSPSAPSPSAPSPSVPTAGPTSPSPADTVRDVSKLGAPAERGREEYLVSDFASADGSLRCFISTAGAGCQGDEWAPGVRPSPTICDEGAVLGPELWGSEPAAWACGTDPHSLPDPEAEDGRVAWMADGFGESLPATWDSSANLAALPAGRTLVAGDLSCSSTADGVACANARTGEGFAASYAEVTLRP